MNGNVLGEGTRIVGGEEGGEWSFDVVGSSIEEAPKKNEIFSVEWKVSCLQWLLSFLVTKVDRLEHGIWSDVFL